MQTHLPRPRFGFVSRSSAARYLLAGLCVAALAAAARADVRLPRIISDHAVLQRDFSVPIWGWADAGEEITVWLGEATQTTRAGADGKWQVRFDKRAAGGPHRLSVKGKNMLIVNDVWVGEVWLASGQSNMQWTVRDSRDFQKERAAANFPQIRMFEVPRKTAREPQSDCEGSWKICSPDTVAGFSAAAYYFGRDLYQQLHVPIGLINSSYGGTPIEAWTSLPAQKGHSQVNQLVAMLEKRAADFDPVKERAAYEAKLAAYKDDAAEAKAAGKKPPPQPRKPGDPRDQSYYPAVLFNAMISPLIPYGIRGAIWYQGESNGGGEYSGKLYEAQLKLLVQDWRTRWGEGNFPFAWVQLPNYTTSATGWPYVRESMLKTLALPNTGMTINMDIGESNDIHPKNKQDIGHRLALWALARVYGHKIVYSGPLPAGQQVKGNVIVLSFQHATGLTAKGGELRGFQIAGADKQWQPANAVIVGSQVVVSSPKVPEPAYVRYDWANDPDGNLVNGAGLPASPFRTDTD
jgi:hypothetical protein